MAKEGLPEVSTANLDGSGLKVAVISATWNEEICDRLHVHAIKAAAETGATVNDYRVVGALELPVAVQAAAKTHDAVVANGCVVKGGTPHFDYVCDSVTAGLTRIALDEGVPVGNGVLTTNTLEQAIERSGGPGSVEDKGAEAAIAAIHTALVLRNIRQDSQDSQDSQVSRVH
ncbi:6,7-dimethyl-8-ribityllumazine synthase [Corynebacterium caspium]|uniref:6,7-dimethyl-8-ribityllumazine synthase n=1 Tax=Corynebacterium caspium TaxID=234828 RepID=UPI00035E11C6|nr:6,7-dimethyl-8-ribityllumazine synthase [Corynebacterium caspium]WKD59230.1 6,7-dimethyl-8-ribityllumazine synthase [Corynebacterium caspium DSM 44850]